MGDVADVPGAKLNLGCGLDVRDPSQGWVNMDFVSLPGVDVVHDMMRTPWPIEPSSFDLVFASHVMEHIPHHHESGRDGFVVIMEEIWRVLKPGGTLVVRVPHYSHTEYCEADPTHTRTIYPRTWRHFDDASGLPTWYSEARFTLEEERVSRHEIGAADKLRIRGVGLTTHLSLRLPFTKRLFQVPAEAEYVLRKQA